MRVTRKKTFLPHCMYVHSHERRFFHPPFSHERGSRLGGRSTCELCGSVTSRVRTKWKASSSHSLYYCLGFVPSLVLFSFLLSCVSFYLIATLSSRATRRKSCYVISSGSTFHILKIIRLQNTSKDGWLKQFTVYSIWWTSILVF